MVMMIGTIHLVMKVVMNLVIGIGLTLMVILLLGQMLSLEIK